MILLVASVVVLATVVDAMTLGFVGELRSPSPQGGFTAEPNPTGSDNTNKPYFELTYEAGPGTDPERIVIRDEAGTRDVGRRLDRHRGRPRRADDSHRRRRK